MGASSVLIFNERTTSWRTQEPSIVAASVCNIATWAYAPRRRALVWLQGGESSTSADYYSYLPDNNLEIPILGGQLQTFPLIPDGDPVAMKRFHEVVFTFSLMDDAVDSLSFTVSVGTAEAGATTALAQPLVANSSPPTVAAPSYFQLRHMVTRQASVAPYLIVNLFRVLTVNGGRWRLHAIDVAWEPISNRSYNRG